ncbi:MAG: carboxypeptidase regulatory-like domain-containing protein [Prolixibacteraceae bacterium]
MKIQFVVSLICFFLFSPFLGQAQLVSVSGFVKNLITGEAKSNVTVFESGSGIGTITNKEGYYRLLLSPGQQNLELSSSGFQKYTTIFNLMADTTITVKLAPHELTEEKAADKNDRKPEPYEAHNSKIRRGKESN